MMDAHSHTKLNTVMSKSCFDNDRTLMGIILYYLFKKVINTVYYKQNDKGKSLTQ